MKKNVRKTTQNQNQLNIGVHCMRPICEQTQKGITIIALVITIIVLLILAGITLYLFSEKGPIEQAKMSKFATEYREVEERVNLYIIDKDIQEETKKINGKEKISEQNKMPVISKLTISEKEEIVNKIPSLKKEVEETSGKTINEMNLYWIDKEKIQVEKVHKYIIDVETRKIYDYEGQKIFNRMWHTLNGGIGQGGMQEEEEDIWDGWIRLTLYYPAGSTEKQWRLGEEGETRYDQNLMWKDYIGPIMVRLSEVENVWIKYKLNNEEIIIPPLGRVLVDIQPDSYIPKLVDKVKIKIVYEKDATIKEYKIGNSDWQEYTEEFYVTENTIVEARAKKTQKICDAEGNIIAETENWGRDNIYVGNIGIQEIDLPAPTLTRKPAQTEDEIAKVEAIYPEGAVRKIYKINYGEEKEYTDEINITKYGTNVIAYYYNAENKRSKSKQITIKEIETPEEGYTPNNPGTPGGGSGGGGSGGSGGSSGGSNPTTPSYEIPKPIITLQPSSVTQTTQVSINVPSGQIAKKQYIKIGNGSYKEYTQPIEVNVNTVVKAYYITEKGEISRTATKRIDNIQETGMPYVKIQANPDPYIEKYGIEKVQVTITGQDTDTLEYSYNGVEYTTYVSPLEITKNMRIYAKGTNSNGEKVTYIDITNIGSTAPPQKEKLNVTINVEPEPELTSGLIDKVQVTIDYDKKATKKYYKIGEKGNLQEYTGTIEITSNNTIYAYAISEKGYGEAQKQIDNLTTGIASPKITAQPGNKTQASKTTIDIKYDKTATVKKYKIDSGDYIDYTGNIEIEKNCKITAYNSSKFGYEAISTYEVTNIVPQPPILVLDQGKYYIIKLNYPPNSTKREYKWQIDGEWKPYKEEGILLIKPEYKDEILASNGTIKIKIKDETGKLIDFGGDWYLVTKPIQELMENVFMRWDRQNTQAPSIILNTNEPTRKVTANIIYNSSLIKKEYKIVEPDGTTKGWQDYTGAIEINRKNTIIYARGQDEAEVYSAQAIKKITNIDEEPPIIKIAADLENTQQKVGMKIEVTDDVRVDTLKWAKGIQKASYFETNGNQIQNNIVIYAKENGYYTIYAKDGVGNTQTYTIQVNNIDLNAPEIQIEITPNNIITTEIKVKINYGDSTIKQYKIGQNNTTWSNYTEELTVTSYTVLAKKWKNEDNTVTIYAKGRDSVGNETIVNQKVISLDLDEPKQPIIESNYGYPILTQYGVQFDGETKITYDTRNDIDNYYSIDNGTTWNKYEGSFQIPGTGIIMAKSIKKVSGLEIITSKTITMPADAMGPAAFDGDYNTYASNIGLYNTWVYKKIYIDPNMWGKNFYYSLYMNLRNGDGAQLGIYNAKTNSSKAYITYSSSNSGKSHSGEIVIPDGSQYIYVTNYNQSSYTYIYEIQAANNPKINSTVHYPKLTQNEVNQLYEMVKIDYFPTSVKRLYKINEDGEWKEYQNKEIRVELGQTIYVKGIDKNGIETRTIPSKTVSMPRDAIGPAAYDGNSSTYDANFGGSSWTNKKIYIDPSMWGKKFYYSLYTYLLNGEETRFSLYNENTNLSTIYIRYTSYNSGKSHSGEIVIPEGTTYMYIQNYGTSSYTYMYEVQPVK